MTWTSRKFSNPAKAEVEAEDGNVASRHLSHQQICDLLFANQCGAADVNLGSEHEAHQQHLDACLICASELSLLQTSVTGFRDVSIALADRALARQTRSNLLSARQSSNFFTPTFFWAATGILFAAVLPIGLLNQNLNPFLKPHAVAPIATTASVAPVHTVESDEALLEDINQDLSASVPSAMQPLADSATDSSSSSTKSLYLQNEKE
jgi:hypothetical protein